MSIYSVNQLISSVSLERFVAIELHKVTLKVSTNVRPDSDYFYL